ncbi:hypothetical protein EAY27_25125, partial [Vibrio anguillarum]|uniref:hypothetical protein n=2 Tax=Vibrio anguillarum TaxID=55601 RepID=UPI001889F486
CFPKRINKVFYTIESLFNQSFDYNYSIVLYLSKDEFSSYLDIPHSIRKLVNRGLVVKFVSDNIRSYKKLHYAYQEFKYIPIVTVDDDIFYPRNWLSKIYSSHIENEDDIIYMRGREITFNNNNIDFYNYMPQAKGYSRSFLSIPTGVSGILYPPNSLHADFSNVDIFMSLSPTADDLWYKIMTLKNNKRCFLANGFSIHYPPVLGTQSISLRKINLSDGKSNNDIQFDALLKHYNINLRDYMDL